MIISSNSASEKEEFQNLLHSTLLELNRIAKTPKDWNLLKGDKLEPFIEKIMIEQAVGTLFENSIECTSAQDFPDIVAKKYYGVEVKSTTSNHWKTTGNSVLESTRKDGVERIYMLFGKLGKPIEFRCRPYEECLSEVVVTHSPRYLIDMNLPEGSTIFDKMKIGYDELRKKSNPLKSVVDYYKSKLNPGQDIWWLDKGEEKASDFIIKIWNELSSREKLALKRMGMTFFPELFSNGSDKFGRLAIWLVTRKAIVCPNVRDLFTAGGKNNITVAGKRYSDVPRIIITLVENISFIISIIKETEAAILTDHWRFKTSEKTKIEDWIKLVTLQAKTIHDASHLNINEIIKRAVYNS
jgi:hypothetical protein